MKENHKLKKYFSEKWSDFQSWFNERQHRSKLNKNVFFNDLIKFTALVVFFSIIYSNIGKLEQMSIWILRIAPLVELVLLYFIIKKGWHLIINLKYAFKGAKNGFKGIMAIVVIVLLILTFVNQEQVVNSFAETWDEIEFNNLNPLNLEGVDFSNFNFLPKKIEIPLGTTCSELEAYSFGSREFQDFLESFAKIDCINLCDNRGHKYDSVGCKNDDLICYCVEKPLEEDSLTSQCTQSLKECISISEKKYDLSISILETERFETKKEAEEFFNTWKGVFQLSYEYEGIKIYPVILSATKMRGPGGTMPYVASCGPDGKLTQKSKTQFLC